MNVLNNVLRSTQDKPKAGGAPPSTRRRHGDVYVARRPSHPVETSVRMAPARPDCTQHTAHMQASNLLLHSHTRSHSLAAEGATTRRPTADARRGAHTRTTSRHTRTLRRRVTPENRTSAEPLARGASGCSHDVAQAPHSRTVHGWPRVAAAHSVPNTVHGASRSRAAVAHHVRQRAARLHNRSRTPRPSSEAARTYSRNSPAAGRPVGLPTVSARAPIASTATRPSA